MNAAASSLETVRHWEAELDIRLEHRSGATRMIHRRQRGPLAVQRLLHPEGDLAHLYLLHPPGGVVGGDAIDIDVSCGESAAALVTTPGATKFYRGNGHPATHRQCLAPGPAGSLEWFPQESIFFDGAVVDLRTDIRLPDEGAFMAWEINCFGRPAAGEAFQSGRVRSLLRVFDAEHLLLHERFHHEPAQGRGNGPVGLRGHPVSATLLAASVDDAATEQVREHIGEPGFPCGVTRLERLLVVRCLDWSAEAVRELLMRVWRCLRPILLDRVARVPRIWAT